ncbi:MAG: hypothetical protein AB8G16_07625 [Gammaproteobacteria bacterium]
MISGILHAFAGRGAIGRLAFVFGVVLVSVLVSGVTSYFFGPFDDPADFDRRIISIWSGVAAWAMATPLAAARLRDLKWNLLFLLIWGLGIVAGSTGAMRARSESDLIIPNQSDLVIHMAGVLAIIAVVLFLRLATAKGKDASEHGDGENA